MLDIENINGFDWDEGNIDNNWIKHRVSNLECEELFFNLPLLLADDKKHSQTEKRYYALGQTNTNGWFFIVFTIRENKIRVISARNMSPKEKTIYAKTNP